MAGERVSGFVEEVPGKEDWGMQVKRLRRVMDGRTRGKKMWERQYTKKGIEK